MIDNQKKQAGVKAAATHKLNICLFSTQPQIKDAIIGNLTESCYILTCFDTHTELVNFIKQHKGEIDCLICVQAPCVKNVLNQLWELGISIPVAIVETEEPARNSDDSVAQNTHSLPTIYHSAETRLYCTQLEQINSYINFAIGRFINLTPHLTMETNNSEAEGENINSRRDFLILQQRRLTEKLKERLSYLGFFSKRNTQDFYRNLSSTEKKKLSAQFIQDYRQIILNYFNDDVEINSLIDKFVDRAFFADLSISKILEIHMEIMDDFSQQLKIEGRSEEILLDYRLALIDIIAHLCEMYRRSIPGEDISLELLFGVE